MRRFDWDAIKAVPDVLRHRGDELKDASEHIKRVIEWLETYKEDQPFPDL